jgi:hypothetical protein
LKWQRDCRDFDSYYWNFDETWISRIQKYGNIIKVKNDKKYGDLKECACI